MEDHDRYINAFSCHACPFPLRENEQSCPKCEAKIDLVMQKKKVDIAKSFEKTIQLASKDEICTRIEQSIRFFEAAYHPKSMELGKVYDQSAEHLCKLAASDQSVLFDEAAKYCEKSVNIISHIFGNDSMEAAQEHFKLCTILMAGTNMDRAVQAIGDGIKLHSKLYGLSSAEKGHLEKMLHFVSLRRT